MTSAPPSAEKTLLACSADGEVWPVHIRVWPPQPSDLARVPFHCVDLLPPLP